MSVGRIRYRFGLFETDPDSGRLLRDGAPIRLQEQPFQVLLALLERHGEVVTRDQLRQRLWPGDTFVEFDKSLGVALAKLRSALGDDAANPRFVETVPRRGYRFIAPVAIEGGQEDPASPASPVTAEVARRASSVPPSPGPLVSPRAWCWPRLLARRGRVALARPCLRTRPSLTPMSLVIAEFANTTGDAAFDRIAAPCRRRRASAVAVLDRHVGRDGPRDLAGSRSRACRGGVARRSPATCANACTERR